MSQFHWLLFWLIPIISSRLVFNSIFLGVQCHNCHYEPFVVFDSLSTAELSLSTLFADRHLPLNSIVTYCSKFYITIAANKTIFTVQYLSWQISIIDNINSIFTIAVYHPRITSKLTWPGKVGGVFCRTLFQAQVQFVC